MISTRIRKVFVGACAALLVVLAPAASSGGAPATPPIESAKVDADVDRNGISERLEERLGRLGQQERAEVLVRLATPATAERVAALERALGPLSVGRRFSLVKAFSASLTRQQIAGLADLPGVAHVEENSRVHALNDTAQTSFGVTAARSQAPALDGGDGLPAYSKDDLVAAVIDTGIDPGHLDLDEGKVLAFADCVDETCETKSAFDDHGHGTHVAATIAGDGDARADKLYQGVAPEGALVGVKVLAANGSGTDAGVIAGVQWAVENKDLYGIEAINLSLGGDGCSDGSDLLSGAVNAAHDAGLVVAVAAGNSGAGTCTISSPGAAAKAVTVAAMSDLGVNGFALADFSSRGKTLDGRIKPDVAAPGVAVTSAIAGTTNTYEAWSGTSMATPFVAGVALLMRDADPLLTPDLVKAKLTATAQDWGRGGDNKTAGSTGADIDYGAGRLDAYAALQSAGASLTAPPAAPVHAMYEGSLSASGAYKEYLLNVTDTQHPIAATLIIPSISGRSAFSPDFDLYLYSPSGTIVARAETAYRQDAFGYKPTTTGTYRLRVRSYSGSGAYFVDVSAGTGPDTTAPAAPAGLTAAAGNAQVSLDWSNNAEGDIAGYRVYRRNADGTWPATALATTATSAYTDTSLTNGTTYVYRVSAYDNATPLNESAPSSEASATPVAPPPAPTVKSYTPAGYLIGAGTVYNGTGAVSRLSTNDGVRVEINSASSGTPRVSELQPYATITAAEQSSLSKLTVNFDAGVSSSSASLAFRVCSAWSGSACTSWQQVASYGTGTTSDRSFTWTSTSPNQYVSPSGEIRVSVRGTRNSSSSFRTRTDWIRFTIES
jgi:serine protease AprX